MDSDAGQVDNWVTLAEAAKLLGKSEKTLRRRIAAGDLDKEAVRREETTGGFRYLLRRADVEKLVGAKARTGAADLGELTIFHALEDVWSVAGNAAGEVGGGGASFVRVYLINSIIPRRRAGGIVYLAGRTLRAYGQDAPGARSGPEGQRGRGCPGF